MVRNVSSGLQTHLNGEVTTLATCWKLTRRDSTVLGLTDHDVDLVISGVTYIASAGFTPSEVALKNDFSVSNLDVDGFLDSEAITEADIIAGLYDFAEIEIFLVNYANVSDGVIQLNRGWLGEVTLNKGQFVAEVRGLSQKISQNFGRVYTPVCGAVLGDSRCAKVLTSFTHSSTITSVTDNGNFVVSGFAQDASYFTGGQIEFTSGNNDGLKMEIKEHLAGGVLALSLPMPYTVQVGDGVTAIAGCDKTSETCKDKFSNLINFRGFPTIPGMDQLFETAGTISSEN